MNQCVRPGPVLRRRNRWQDKRARQLKKLANMRAAKARRRLERGAAGLLEREPKMVRWYPLEVGVRDRTTGEEAWVVFKSLRDALRRLTVLVRYYEPGGLSINPDPCVISNRITPRIQTSAASPQK